MHAHPTKVLIADDHAIVRQALRQLLADEQLGFGAKAPDLHFAEVESLDGTLEALAGDGADLLLIDLSMPGMSGPHSLRALREAYPATKIVVVSGREERAIMLDCLAAGVHGFVPKSLATEQIVAAIERILAGGVYVPAEITNLAESPPVAAPESRGSLPPSPDVSRFTKRQRDVLQLLAQGRSTKEIARALALGEGTVKVHLAAIYRVLNARSRGEAVALASKLAI